MLDTHFHMRVCAIVLCAMMSCHIMMFSFLVQFMFAGLYPEATAALQEMADYINTHFAK